MQELMQKQMEVQQKQPSTTSPASLVAPFRLGDRVEAKTSSGDWAKAVVEDVNPEGTRFTVRFDEGGATAKLPGYEVRRPMAPQLTRRSSMAGTSMAGTTLILPQRGDVSELKNQVATLQTQMETTSKELRDMIHALSDKLDAWTASASWGGRRRRNREDEHDPVLPSSQLAGHVSAPPIEEKIWTSAKSAAVLPSTSPQAYPVEKRVPNSHDKCKLPTNPSALVMSKSLGRLPKLKGAPLGH